MNRRTAIGGGVAWAAAAAQQIPGSKPRNIVFILTDDHRYDALGFMKGQAFLQTPVLDSLARDGAHLRNAFVTTALCSPSRASILTGKYAHKHKIVDNNTAIPPGTTFFPQDLQKAGYTTGFFGKWHMGSADDNPQPGFTKWVSFRGQGNYLPGPNGLNVDGKRVPQKGYITDELTDYAVDWIKGQEKGKPFFAYISHKAVHSEFIPAPRHKGKFDQAKFVRPESMDATKATGRPMWVQNQRNSWHGVDFPYHSDLNIEEYYKRYAETLLAVDEGVGRVMQALRDRGELESTLIVYMGDNGFAFGEHGLIDKRTAYEESMRVPMLAHCPELIRAGTTIDRMVAGIDIMPTFLAAAGVRMPAGGDGASFLGLLQGQTTQWRESLLYEYYWERNFPQTPTLHALRREDFKYVRYHGIWDSDELYDLKNDPKELRNLIDDPKHRALVKEMNEALFRELIKTDGMSMPLYPDSGGKQSLRSPKGPPAADFPEGFKQPPPRRR